MKIKQEKQERAYAIKFTVEDSGEIVGRAYLYIIYNDLHDSPYGLMEDVFVDASQRGKGIGTKLVYAIIEKAKAEGCYKLIGQSRYKNKKVHELYLHLGFEDHGKNFRIDLFESKAPEKD